MLKNLKILRQSSHVSGTMYWRFDEDEMHVELDYPRDMSMWRGIGYDIDSAFQYKDGERLSLMIIKAN